MLQTLHFPTSTQDLVPETPGKSFSLKWKATCCQQSNNVTLEKKNALVWKPRVHCWHLNSFWWSQDKLFLLKHQKKVEKETILTCVSWTSIQDHWPMSTYWGVYFLKKNEPGPVKGGSWSADKGAGRLVKVFNPIIKQSFSYIQQKVRTHKLRKLNISRTYAFKKHYSYFYLHIQKLN